MTTRTSSPARERSASESWCRVPDVAAVLVPIGGGGLASGVGTALRALRPGVRLIGINRSSAADARESLPGRTGRIEWPTALGRRTIADGTGVNTSGSARSRTSCALFDDVVTVDETGITAAIRLIAERSQLVAEPSGALTVAAADVPCRRGRADRDRRLGGGPGERRQRGSRALPGIPGGADPARALRRPRPPSRRPTIWGMRGIERDAVARLLAVAVPALATPPRRRGARGRARGPERVGGLPGGRRRHRVRRRHLGPAPPVAAFLLYNYLFVEPRYTLAISEPAELINLFLLLFVGIVVGQLAALQRARAETARRASARRARCSG